MAPPFSPFCGDANGSCWLRSLLCPLLAYVAITQLTPRYTATGTLIYDASESKVREMQSILRVDPITDAVMATQAEVLRGMPVDRAGRQPAEPAHEPGIQSHRCDHRHGRSGHWPAIAADAVRFGAGSGSLAAGPRLDPARNATLTAVRAALTVTPLKASRVLEVSFTAEDPVIAAAAANDAMDVYVKSQLGAKYGAVARPGNGWSSAREELRKECGAYEGAIAQVPRRRTVWSRACMRGSTANRSAC